MGECAALFVCAAASFGEDVCSLPGPQLARRAAMWPACERPSGSIAIDYASRATGEVDFGQHDEAGDFGHRSTMAS